MNTKIKTLTLAAALAASLGLAGCAADSGNNMPMNHGSSGPVSSMMPDANADHNQADVMFSQMMIPHHDQAVEMSDIILAKPDIPAEVTALATRIKDAGTGNRNNGPVAQELECAHHDVGPLRPRHVRHG